MQNVRSKDGTLIAFETAGSGPPLILVDGALCHRRFGPMKALSRRLADRFTVYTYDRRGRGDSGDTPPYRVEREIEDLDALVSAAGGWAYACGMSSGAALALDAAAKGVAFRKVAAYEPPFIVDNERDPLPEGYPAAMKRLIAEGRRGAAVTKFMKVVGAPWFVIQVMRLTPAWSKLKAVAHTLVYDTTIMADRQQGRPLPAGLWSGNRSPALVISGGKSPTWMRNGAQAAARAAPHGRHETLAGQTHMVKAEALAPMLVEFFTNGD